MEGKVVLVTGGTGFIGSHLARALESAGAELRLVVRSTSSLKWIREVRHGPYEVDLARGDDLSAALDGVDFVFHLAGVLRAARGSDYLRGNVEATRHLLSAASRLPVPPRVILVSSLAAAGPSPDGTPWKEEDPPRPVGMYGESKLLAEKAAFEAGKAVPLVILRPPLVYGPREADLLGACRAVRRGLLPQIGRGPRTFSVIMVRDLVEAIIGAALRAPPGRVYYTSHPEILTWVDLLSAMAEVLGTRPRRVVLPEVLVPLLARAGEIVARITGKESILNRERTLEWRHRHWVCDPSRAEREWGFRAPTPYREGIRETIDWYLQEGWL